MFPCEKQTEKQIETYNHIRYAKFPHLPDKTNITNEESPIFL